MKKAILSLVALILLTLTLTVSAQASVLSLDVSGDFSSTTAFDTVPFDSATPFTYHALFESTAVDADGYFPISSLTLEFKATTYTMLAGANVKVFISEGMGPGAGLIFNGATYFNAFYYITTPTPWDPAAPTPLVFTGFSFSNTSDNLSIPLTGGSTLTNIGWDVNSKPTAEITSGGGPAAVPEPSTYALLCIGLGVIGYARKKMVKREE